MLLRDPVFKRSTLIKDPAKVAEGFNRTAGMSANKQHDQSEQSNDKPDNDNDSESKPMRLSQSAPRLDQLGIHPKSMFV